MYWFHTTGNSLEIHNCFASDPGAAPSGQTKVQGGCLPEGWYPYEPPSLLAQVDAEMASWTNSEKEEVYKLLAAVNLALICSDNNNADRIIDGSSVLDATKKNVIKGKYVS